MGIREVRKSKGITQRQLAQAIGVGFTVISKYEKGIIIPPADRLVRMANYLGVTVDRLLSEESESEKNIPASDFNIIGYSELDRFSVMQFKVSKEVISLANGTCELCGNKAPFCDENGKPYLEAHFVRFLSEGGSPTLDNVVALCPNCHKKIHILHSKKDIEQLQRAAEEHVCNKKNVDYMIEDEENILIIENLHDTRTTSRIRLLEYYTRLLDTKNKKNVEDKQLALNRLIKNMTEQEAEKELTYLKSIVDHRIANGLKLMQRNDIITQKLEETHEVNDLGPKTDRV